MCMMFVLLILAIILSVWAQFRVQGTFKKWAKVDNSTGLTGYDVARHMLDTNGLHDVPIEPVRGALSDHYDPIHRVVRLSEPVYYERSISAVAVASHEVGHAIQHKEHYPMLVLRHRIFPIVNFASGIAPFLLLAGFIFNAFNLIGLGIIFFSVTVAFQLVTLPVEFNASNRARRIIVEEGYVRSEEERGVGKVLNSAALTYVAAALISLLELIRYIGIFTSNRE
ncbi:zinc metallopeptidase [Paenibacillus urinalis]|uniref:Zinc metallopeptidase n=2 Tax=Paenibacillus TaxID=44249 RepID=A0AAX3N5S8_9BACL|nr:MULTISPECIES: zinc metallopeptidase [Paenibacillus]WDH85070.1 zinc metallopeptidase [Paenibacillus urinalis]WDH99992.1 zinc metallopeptidase [Paenibacillus urinalis]WDI04819.1 zinc metallopeptidase [Paenibacillus urinalis]